MKTSVVKIKSEFEHVSFVLQNCALKTTNYKIDFHIDMFFTMSLFLHVNCDLFSRISQINNQFSFILFTVLKCCCCILAPNIISNTWINIFATYHQCFIFAQRMSFSLIEKQIITLELICLLPYRHVSPILPSLVHQINDIMLNLFQRFVATYPYFKRKD